VQPYSHLVGVCLQLSNRLAIIAAIRTVCTCSYRVGVSLQLSIQFDSACSHTVSRFLVAFTESVGVSACNHRVRVSVQSSSLFVRAVIESISDCFSQSVIVMTVRLVEMLSSLIVNS